MARRATTSGASTGAVTVDGATRHMVDQPPGDTRARDRQAMRDVLAARGFEHAVGTIAQGVAVELVPTHARDVDERLERTADEIEDVVLDALVYLARSRGWKRAR